MSVYDTIRKEVSDYYDGKVESIRKSLDASPEHPSRKIFERLAKPLYRGKPVKGSLLASRQKALDAVAAAEKAPVAKKIDIQVEWHRTRLYGPNPFAEVWVSGENGTVFHDASATPVASGGYCKESTAVSDAMEGCPSLVRLVIEAGEDAWDNYAVEKTPFPHLSFGGKGMETFRSFIESIGWRRTAETHGKSFDTYHWVRD